MKIYSIYRIKNNINGKHYIGYTSSKVGHRFDDHCNTKKPKYQDRSIISLAIEKYGRDNFTCDIIYQSKDYDHARQCERIFIEEYNSLTHTQGGHGYNVDFGGGESKRSPETIEKHRAKLKGRPQSEEHKKKKADAIKGEKNGMHGKYGVDSPNYGNKHTKETRLQMKETKAESKRLRELGLKPAIVRGEPTQESNNKRSSSMKNNKDNRKFLEITVSEPSGNIVKLNIDEYLDYFKLHELNNFMPKLIKDGTLKIKGYGLISFKYNPNNKKHSADKEKPAEAG